MKKYLAIFALLASVLSVRAELEVEWINDNEIRVYGIGYVVITNNVCTNSLGSCTNCVQISPELMHAYKTSILSECNSADSDLDGIIHAALEIYERMNQMQQDISSFQRFGKAFNTGVSNSTTPLQYSSLTSYVYSVDNTQTTLDRSYSLHGGTLGQMGQAVSYNDGIYDYANTYILPYVISSKNDAADIVYQSDSAKAHIDTIRTTVQGMSEAACQGCVGDDGGGGGDGGGSCGDCPCAEQLDAIKDYVEHIDDDFHVQLQNMADVTNFIPRMDSYAKLVSGILYNDATIVVDNGENSWSNVYRRGYSDLYDYDKSNILQRIELLLFGLTPISTTTNWGEVADIESDSVNVQQQINGVGSTISEGHDGLSENVTTIRGKISTLFNALNFFGSSNMSTFTLNDPFQVFDVYEVEGIEPNSIDSLESFRNLIRSCFQVVYWVSGIAFMIAFWYFVVSFVVHRVFGFLKFFNNLLT